MLLLLMWLWGQKIADNSDNKEDNSCEEAFFQCWEEYKQEIIATYPNVKILEQPIILKEIDQQDICRAYESIVFDKGKTIFEISDGNTVYTRIIDGSSTQYRLGKNIVFSPNKKYYIQKDCYNKDCQSEYLYLRLFNNQHQLLNSFQLKWICFEKTDQIIPLNDGESFLQSCFNGYGSKLIVYQISNTSLQEIETIEKADNEGNDYSLFFDNTSDNFLISKSFMDKQIWNGVSLEYFVKEISGQYKVAWKKTVVGGRAKDIRNVVNEENGWLVRLTKDGYSDIDQLYFVNGGKNEKIASIPSRSMLFSDNNNLATFNYYDYEKNELISLKNPNTPICNLAYLFRGDDIKFTLNSLFYDENEVNLIYTATAESEYCRSFFQNIVISFVNNIVKIQLFPNYKKCHNPKFENKEIIFIGDRYYTYD